MSNKNKLYALLLILLVLIIFCKLLLDVDYFTYKVEYKKEIFNIKESYKDNYIEIKHLDKIYPLRIDKKTDEKAIKKIYYYSDKNYECLLPIIDNVTIDMMCYKDNIIYNYSNITGENKKLDDFVKNIKEYDIDKFKNNNKVKNLKHTTTFYENDDILKNIAITTYKGLIIDEMEIQLFKDDIYNNVISTFINNYYLIADYNSEYEFNEFYLVNILNKNIEKIKSKNDISLDSYIEGIVDDKVYLYDKDNENQYEINVNNKTIKLISSKDKIKYYKNNKWETINKPSKELYFDYEPFSKDFIRFDYVIENDNYYYLFKNNNDKYDLYRVDKNNIDIYKYIGLVPNKNIITKDDYLYYIDNNTLYYYSDTTSFRTILSDTEFTFNDTIKYYIY